MQKDSDSVDVKFDSTQETSFYTFFKNLPEKLSSTIRFFDRTEYLTVHGKDALFVATEILKTPSAIKHFPNGKKSLEYVVVRRTVFEGVVRELLLVRMYRIEVYNKKNDWSLAYKSSPGNLSQFEELLYSSEVTASSGLIVVKATSEVTGVCYVDMSTYKMVVSEVRAEVGGLEGVVVQLRPMECLVEVGCGKGVKEVMEKNGVALTEVKKGDFDSKNVKQDLSRLLHKDSPLLTESSAVLSCLAASIKYLELLGDDSNSGQFRLQTFVSASSMRLDSSTIRSLNILPSPNCQQAGETLISTLNKCRTRSGQRLLSSWLHQPLTDPNLIEDRQEIVELLCINTELRHRLHDDLLRRMLDPVSTLRRLRSRRATLTDCVKLYKLIKLLPLFLEAFGGAMEEMDEGVKGKMQQMFVTPLEESREDLSRYGDMIEQTVDLEGWDRHQDYLVRADFDDSLGELQERMEEVEAKMKKELSRAATDLGLEAHKSIKLDSNQQQGFFLRLTRKEEKCLRGNEKTYKVLDATKGGVRFRSNHMQAANERYMALKEEFVAQQKSVVAEVVMVAVGYIQPLEALVDLLSVVDVFVSLATACSSAPRQYVKPRIIRGGVRTLELVGARHPCLERKDALTYIPNDLNLHQDAKTMCIITGPNMGGKSTYIRSVGLIVVMAQVGCLVPCDSASVGVVDALFARVGAGDDQANGVSTFMAEMLETSTILKTATSRSLVIVDELGRGTSTYDGFGLAHAIAKHIATEIGSMCLFASHFHELTSLADELACVCNLHATAAASPSSLTLLYKIEPGICDQSFGIHVAEMVNFPDRVLKKARLLANNMEKCTTIIIGKDGDDEKDADDGDDGAATKKRKITLESIRSFLQQARSLSNPPSPSPSSSHPWQQLQLIKQKY